VTPYSRPQLRALLALAGLLTVGLGVREWRAGFPERALQLERFDRDDRDMPVALVEGRPVEPGPRPMASRPGARRTEPAPPRSRRPTASPRSQEAPAGEAVPSPEEAPPLDLNRASVEDLSRLPGIGPGLAQRIVEERARRGRFDSVEGLRGVLGLGPKKVAALRSRLTVED
jgi:competence ComEA-like helix-hairpin-helix protein